MGLYFKISIVLFYLPIFLICLRRKKQNEKFKLFSLKRYSRYIKLIFTPKVLKIIIIFSIISNSITLYRDFQFKNKYQNLDNEKISLKGLITNKIEDKYIIKINNNNFYLTGVKKNLKYGDKIIVDGTYIEPSKQTNYKGFNYKNYLKTKKVYGTIKVNNIKVISKNNGNIILKYVNKTKNIIEEKLYKSNLNEEEKGILKGILLGNKEEISEEQIEDFSKSNISHILAISGMHVSYIIMFVVVVLNKIIGKHSSKPIASIVVIFYISLVNFTPSAVRAGITGIIFIMSGFFYKQNDFIEALSISLILILIENPFKILDVSLNLSYLGAIGIFFSFPILSKFIKLKIEQIENRAIRRNRRNLQKFILILKTEIVQKVLDVILITISVTIFIIPIVGVNFNTLTITSIVISVLTSFIIGPIIFLSFLFLIFKNKLILILLKINLKILIYLSAIGAKMPLNQIFITTPSMLKIVFYYFFVCSLLLLTKIKIQKNLYLFHKRILNIFQFIKYKILQNKNRFISIILIVVILQLLISIVPKKLKIYFVDVGQGECTLITTPYNKKILIDGGGSESFDVGRKTVIPYLLSRKIKKLDYIIISHYDQDHIGGIFTVMEELKVETVVISKQGEMSENYEKFKNIVSAKNIKVQIVGKGDTIKIEKDLYIDILWPNTEKLISENILNNNSIVCKMRYKDFSCLFTGDIEEIAEKQILEQYKGSVEVLKSKVLKVAHHGSKTSTTLGFLKAVSPKIALIGVGKNNNFGHPNKEIIERLQINGIKVYRTDQNGEISIIVNKKGFIEIFCKTIDKKYFRW